jgi:predicted dehydrogenase
MRIAVIGRTGHGDYGHSLDTVWLEVPSVQVVAVSDDNSQGLAAAATRLHVDKTFADYRTMLDDVKPDVVSVAPRWIDQHHQMAIACAQRGIHMYMEKPFCRTLVEADEIVTACERTQTKLAIACQAHYSPKLPAVNKAIEEGKIGRVLEFRARGKEDASRGGSEDLWVLGTHMLDLVRFLGGQPQWCFASLTERGKPVAKSDIKEGVEGLGPLAGDHVQATYGFKDEAMGYFASRRGMGKGDARFALQVFGTDGVIDIASGYMGPVRFLPDPTWCPGRSKAKWLNLSSAGIDQPEPIKKGGNLEGNRIAVVDLLAAIKENRQPLCSMYDARGTLEMIHAIFDSHRQRQAVSLPLKNRQHALTMLS